MPSELGIIPMNSTGFVPILSSIPCPVEFDRSNFKFDRARNTAQNELKFMDLLPIQLGMKYCSIWVSSLWIYTHFEQYFMPGRIRPVEFDRSNWELIHGSNWVEIHGFTPNSCPVELGIIPMNSTEFTPILSSISCPVEFDRSNFKFDRA